ncbi:hypothetical protein LTR53_015198 [Teratosphaeriaceae sp. CCFEE 6253]|nr:hypothetical protein LTR53_015198 [Teratosphaeriaceae sp. CCFEE 6253]
MSKEIVIVAIAHPAPGKLERVYHPSTSQRSRTPSQTDSGNPTQFKEVTQAAVSWIQAHEPGTLAFEVHEQHVEDTTQSQDENRIALIERYASQEALEAHQSSESYQRFFASVMEEGLLVGTPQIVAGKRVFGFSR